MAPKIDVLLVIGAPIPPTPRGWSRSAAAPARHAQLVERAADIDWRALDGVRAVGVTAGASAPEVLVEEVDRRLPRPLRRHARSWSRPRSENVEFKVPRILRAKVA